VRFGRLAFEVRIADRRWAAEQCSQSVCQVGSWQLRSIAEPFLNLTGELKLKLRFVMKGVVPGLRSLARALVGAPFNARLWAFQPCAWQAGDDQMMAGSRPHRVSRAR